MKQWFQHLRAVTSEVEQTFDTLRQRLKNHLQLDDDEIIIQIYQAYGNDNVICIRGRVMQDHVMQLSDRDTLWRNLLNTYQRFETDEIPFAVLDAQFGDHTMQFVADDEGFFDIQLEIEDSSRDTHCDDFEVQLRLVSAPHYFKPQEDEISTYVEILCPPSDAEYGVISDLDDTVIHSDVSSIINLAKNTFLQNAHTRLPFTGVAALYRALQIGTRNSRNPIFYVSSSPWNLYDLLTDFLALKKIPLGPLFLQDFGLNKGKWVTQAHSAHKLSAIKEIMSMYPNLPFVLIGDSTQHDAKIYYEIAIMYPTRIRAIYVRDVNTSATRQKMIIDLAQSLKIEHDIPLILLKDSLQAAQHANEIGIILPEAIQEITLEINGEIQTG
ncbi:MAG: DUF2183 domain-containing protein [Aggregatilineales bacterium]